MFLVLARIDPSVPPTIGAVAALLLGGLSLYRQVRRDREAKTQQDLLTREKADKSAVAGYVALVEDQRREIARQAKRIAELEEKVWHLEVELKSRKAR